MDPCREPLVIIELAFSLEGSQKDYSNSRLMSIDGKALSPRDSRDGLN